MRKRNNRITVNLTLDEYNYIRKLAVFNGISLSRYVEYLVNLERRDANYGND